MNLDDFDFELPPELIAQDPPVDRGASRLLTVHRETGAFCDRHFRDIVSLMHEGDVLVFNNTEVLAARVFAVKPATGGRVEFLFTEPVSADRWLALARPSRSLHVGMALHPVSGDDVDSTLRLVIEAARGQGVWLVRLESANGTPFDGAQLFQRFGVMPLPPYIHRDSHARPDDPRARRDRERYQTVFATKPGAVAAPTAGLHFTRETLDALTEIGVQFAPVTLHVGPGTFLPLRHDEVEKNTLHAERYHVAASSLATLIAARRDKRRIIAVGTTSLRTLESLPTLADLHETHDPRDLSESTSIFIYPGYRIRNADALITNFHLPRSSLMLLVSAFASRDIILNAYRHAVRERYRFFSYGDAMFLHP